MSRNTRNDRSVEAIVSRQETVECAGCDLVLQLPTAEVIAQVRELATASVGLAKEDGTGDIAGGIQLFTQAQIKGIAGCLDVDEDTASQLLAVSGGDAGDLAVAVRSMLGMNARGTDDDEPDPSTIDPLLQ